MGGAGGHEVAVAEVFEAGEGGAADGSDEDRAVVAPRFGAVRGSQSPDVDIFTPF